MKFVVFKGTAGWGDRLQCLLQVIKYARATGRYLVCDWRDKEWSHDGKVCLDQYCTIEGVNTFPLEAFLKLWAEEQHNMTVLPAVWRHHMPTTQFKEFLYKDLFRFKEHCKPLDDISEYRAADYAEDVVVYAGTGYRAFAYADFNLIRPVQWMAREFQWFAADAGLQTGQYDVVHLRAGSKSWAGGVVALKDLKAQIDKQFPTMDSYFNHVQKAMADKQAGAGSEADPEFKMIVLSDSSWLAEKWIQRVGRGQFLDHSFSNQMTASGVHEATASDLQKAGVDKFQVNLDSFRDFAVMLNARHVIHDGTSLFSKMADSCKGSAHASWLFSA